MNDVPAVIAWVIALVVAAAVAVSWVIARRVPEPAATRWRWRAIAWTLTAATIGPVVVVLIVTVASAIGNWRAFAVDPLQRIEQMVGAIMFLSVWYVLVGVAFFALPYLPILLLWARLGSRLGRLETSLKGLAFGALLLGLPAAIAGVIAYGVQDEPFGYKGSELMTFGILILFATSVSLFIPRLLIRALRPGIFGAGLRESLD